MITDYSGGVAVVTGGASGLGQSTAKALADAGLKVVIFDLNADSGEAHAGNIGGAFIRSDIRDPESVAAAMVKVDEVGSLRVIVNCAGVGGAGKTVSRGLPHDAKLFERVIGINLIGSFNVATQGAALMVKTDPMDKDGARGVIVNTASVAAFDGQIGQLAYAASKGGIVGMTLPMARDLAAKGIRVCTLAPGLFRTPLLDDLPEDVQQSLGAQVPFPSRLGAADEYARMVCSILDNPMLNGEVIRLDGAIRMAPR
jgi:NAD(P)-dependent dehydrogenase (short-subunit alcohol dehydrogenase family)